MFWSFILFPQVSIRLLLGGKLHNEWWYFKHRFRATFYSDVRVFQTKQEFTISHYIMITWYRFDDHRCSYTMSETKCVQICFQSTRRHRPWSLTVKDSDVRRVYTEPPCNIDASVSSVCVRNTLFVWNWVSKPMFLKEDSAPISSHV